MKYCQNLLRSSDRWPTSWRYVGVGVLPSGELHVCAAPVSLLHKYWRSTPQIHHNCKVFTGILELTYAILYWWESDNRLIVFANCPTYLSLYYNSRHVLNSDPSHQGLSLKIMCLENALIILFLGLLRLDATTCIHTILNRIRTI